MTTLTATITKEIRYSRLTKDYDMYLDGEYVGSEASYHAAEVELDRLAYEQLDRAGVEPELLQSATALDAGSDQDEIAAALAAESLTTAIHLDGETSIRTHETQAKRDEYLRYNPSARIVDVAALPIANFRPTIAGPLWDQGYTSPNLPNSARDFRFTVDACPVCQRLLNHSIYANAAGAWLAYDWCLECDRGRLAGQSCAGIQFSCNRPATQTIPNAAGAMHLCDEHAAEWRSYGPNDDQSATDPGHNLTLPDPAECPDISAPQPVKDLPGALAEPEDGEEDDDYKEGDPRDEDVYAPPFGLPAPSGRSACERYSTPPLALWGPDTLECPKCHTRHDPVVACPVHCANCDRPHHIQRCPEVWRALMG